MYGIDLILPQILEVAGTFSAEPASLAAGALTLQLTVTKTPWQEDEANQRKQNRAALESRSLNSADAIPFETAPDHLLDNSKLTSYN